MTPLKIGISFTPVKMHNYLLWFNRQGLAKKVELVDLNYLQNNTAHFDQCDGFILTGGDDVDPALYGGKPTYANMPAAHHSKRDVFETKLFEHSQYHHKPLLGICRGLQLVNVILGGSLVQDLGPKANLLHSNLDAVDKYHEVSITPNTFLHAITGVEKETVNSAHHQVAQPGNLGTGLMINAVSTTGEIEGLEYAEKNSKPFMLLVQWHPERIPDQQNVLSKNIIHTFVQATNNR